jgi:hypothetical protein
LGIPKKKKKKINNNNNNNNNNDYDNNVVCLLKARIVNSAETPIARKRLWNEARCQATDSYQATMK